MKKRFLSALFLFMILLVCLPGRANAAGDVELNEANFPDEVFRAVVAENFDTDGSGSLSQTEIANATRLYCMNEGITDLTGVKLLTELTFLQCAQNELTSLDVSNCSKLITLLCYNNNLNYLNVTGCTDLVRINCNTNSLTSLNVSGCTNLQELECINNSLTSLNISGCTNLQKLDCGSNRLTDLNVSQCTDLFILRCESNNLTTLDVSRCPLLALLWCHYNMLEALDISSTLVSFDESRIGSQKTGLSITVQMNAQQFADFEACCTEGGENYSHEKHTYNLHVIPEYVIPEVAINDTNFPDKAFRTAVAEKFDTDGNGSLSQTEIANATELHCPKYSVGENYISDLTGVKILTNLTTLDCSDNKLTLLDVSDLTNLTTLNCKGNGLTTLDITGCTNLQELNCSENSLTTLDVSQHTNLFALTCYTSELTTLNVSGLTKLTTLDCNWNELTTLDVSGCTNLKKLWCYCNKLTTLDVSKCISLEDLFCGENRFATLDVSGLKNLAKLECINDYEADFDAAYWGQGCLTTLKASGCTNLNYLNCGINCLTKLDVSGCTNLKELWCFYNFLTTLDVSGCPNLQKLWCDGNELTTLDVSGCPNLQELVCDRNELTTLIVTGCTDLAITTQPASTTVTEGSTATFKVVATGASSYQWQWRENSTSTWKDCSSATAGYNTATLKPVGTAAKNGYQYRCVVKDAFGNFVTSNAVTLTVKAGLAITTQPASASVTDGSTATFKVVAANAASYQWQWRDSSTGTWKDCSSATSGYTTDTLKPVGTAARNGYQYRCVVKDSSDNSVTSDAATLKVLAITTQPANASVSEGSTATFKVVVTNAASYQWQWRASSTGTWTNCSSATSGYNTATLKPVGTAARNGYQYRCVVKDASGNSVTSNTVTLTVKAGLAITTQPVSQTVALNGTASFKVVATGASSYQWQWKAATTDWANCSSATAGYNTANLKPVATSARNGYQYRCVVKDADGKSVTSNTATLTVKAGLAITTQPVSQTVALNESASFKVVATGATSYQWQWRAGSTGTWANCSSATSGYNTATLKPVGTAARNGYQYRCIVKDASGKSVTSNAATLTVKAASALAITAQPVSQAAALDSYAAFTVSVSGSGVTYQWQWRTGASGTWKDCSSATVGYNKATLNPVATAARNGYQYRCIVKDASGNSVTSNTATLTVKTAATLAITTQPVSQTVALNGTASFKVVATGASSYQWQWRAGASGTWANCSSATAGYNTANLKPVGTAARNGYQYRCIVKDTAGNTVTSSVATLKVSA